MDKNELNKYLHEQVMGQCWHEGILMCDKCRANRPSQGGDYTSCTLFPWNNPDYASSLDAVRMVELVLISKCPTQLMDALDLETAGADTAFANAYTRALACKTAWEASA